MDSCDYREVANDPVENENISRKSFLRQLLVCSVVWTCFFVCGLSMGAPTVIVPQIRREANLTEAVSEMMSSWLSSILGYGSIPWVVIMPIAAEYYGRKIPLIIICFITLVGFVVFYLSNSVIQILISEVLESIIGAAVSTILTMVVTEYASPRYRGFFLTFKSATMFWGIWVSNAIGTFFHWKLIGIVKIVCSIYPLVILFFIPESPYWLASKGKFKNCAESHRWLKGHNAELELERLVNLHKDYLAAQISKPFSLGRVRNIILTKEFYKPTLLAILLYALYYFSGKLACTFYSLDMIKKITTSEKAAYEGMLILDGVTVTSMYVGSALSKYVQRRTLLLVSSSFGVLFLFVLSLYTYLIKISLVVENSILSISILIFYSSSISCGPMLMAAAISAELIPLKYRTSSLWAIAVIDRLLMGITVQLLPYVVHEFGLEVAFFGFGVLSFICIVMLYKYLPETKDKTLQVINDIIMGIEHEIDNEASELRSRRANHQV